MSSEETIHGRIPKESKKDLSYLANKLPERHRNDNPVLASKSSNHKNINSVSKSYQLPLKQNEELQHLPRQYQIELFEKAKKDNIIAVLETGTGKTLIAIMLIKHILLNEKVLRLKQPERQRKYCIFLVNTVALAVQQATTIANNIPFRVAQLYGELGVDGWSDSKWQSCLNSTDVLVLTAQIFLDMLRHGKIQMKEIGLIVFDECHHTEKKHPYNLIMKEFYMRYYGKEGKVNEHKPRIFSMTASPLKSASNAIRAANNLESALDSKIFTINYNELAQTYINRPKELYCFYESHDKLFDKSPKRSDLAKIIERYCRRGYGINRLLSSHDFILNNYGEWCGLLYLRKSLEELILKYDAGVFSYSDNLKESKWNSFSEEETSIKNAKKIYESYLSQLKEGKDWLDLDPYDLDDIYVTPKIKKLIECIKKYSSQLNTFCGIIFASRICTVVTLNFIISYTKKVKNIQSDYLLGHNSNSKGNCFHMNVKQQENTLFKFRNGAINLLFATNVAEEGLDIQPCNLVIRFDPPETLISYIQSRGRAREKESYYIVLQEINGTQDRKEVDSFKQSEKLLMDWCQSLPKDRLMVTNNSIESDDDDDEDNGMDDLITNFIYEIPTTKAVITLNSAVALIYRYCNSLPKDSFCEMLPKFKYINHNNYHQCQLTMPSNSKVQVMESDITKSSKVAKQHACFKMAIKLVELNELNEYLKPVGIQFSEEDFEPVKSDYSLAGIQEGTWKAIREYKLKRPHFFKYYSNNEDNNSSSSEWNKCYFNIVNVDELNNINKDNQYRPFIIITQQPLPKFNPIEFCLKGQITYLTIEKAHQPTIPLSKRKIELLFKYTIFSFRSIFNRLFECNINQIQYFIAPIKVNNLNDFNDLIDWDIIKNTLNPLGYPDFNDIDELIICDTLNNNTRYKVNEIDFNLTANSIIPLDSAIKNQSNLTFKEYYNLKFKSNIKDLNQNILRVKKIRIVLNYLTHHNNQNQIKKQIQSKSFSYLLKEFVLAYPLPISIFNSNMLLPSLMTRIEALLLVREVKIKLNLPEIIDEYLLEALTLPSANLSIDYERLELLGDAYLKFISSMDVFLRFPQHHEAQLHNRRLRIISNRSLFRLCRDLELYKYVNPKPFIKSKWYPINFYIKNQFEYQNQLNFKMADKGLADVVEAILGAALLSNGPKLGLKCAQALNIITTNYKNWGDIQNYLPIPCNIDRLDILSELDINFIEDKINYKFQHPILLVEAFTHASHPQPLTSCYQRLEFLGDAILDYLVVDYLFHKYPNEPPGVLSEIKESCVSNNTLATIMETLDLYPHIIHHSSKLIVDITEFIIVIKKLREESELNDTKEYWHDIKAPKVIADVLEALFGAILIDSNFDIKLIQNLFNKLIKPTFDFHLKPNYVIVHPVTQLTRYLHRFGCMEFKFECMKREDKQIDIENPVLCNIWIHGVLIGNASGKVVKQAKKYAAQIVIDKLKAGHVNLDILCSCESSKL
ncbi:hypothetical protein K502DRAFT_304512, partial [Neoconidiobolus thromboides FSU 785]